MTTRHSPEDVARDRGLSVETVRIRCRTAAWPHHRDGRRIYFTDEDLAGIEQLAAVPARPRATGGRTDSSRTYHQAKPTTSGRRSRIR